MLTVLCGAVANLVLDPVFIFVFDLGVRGAARHCTFPKGCPRYGCCAFER